MISLKLKFNSNKKEAEQLRNLKKKHDEEIEHHEKEIQRNLVTTLAIFIVFGTKISNLYLNL